MPLKKFFHFSIWLEVLKNKDFLTLASLETIHLKKIYKVNKKQVYKA